jgi:GTPase
MSENFKSGFVSILGIPNVGKSSFVNKVLGTKILASSKKPQTTRQNVKGIFTTKNLQIIFLDTPGLTNSPKTLNKILLKETLSSLNDADFVVYFFDNNFLKNIEKNTSFIDEIKVKGIKIIPVLNKIDLKKKKEIENIVNKIKENYGFEKVLTLSVTQALGFTELINEIKENLSFGPKFFPEDNITDKNMRFLAAEIIREKVFNLTHQEIPYSVAVSVEKYREEENVDKIYANIYIEKESQKGILIGKGGKKLKQIGTSSRIDIEKMIDKKVYLELFVKLKKDWTRDKQFLKELFLK